MFLYQSCDEPFILGLCGTDFERFVFKVIMKTLWQVQLTILHMSKNCQSIGYLEWQIRRNEFSQEINDVLIICQLNEPRFFVLVYHSGRIWQVCDLEGTGGSRLR